MRSVIYYCLVIKSKSMQKRCFQTHWKILYIPKNLGTLFPLSRVTFWPVNCWTVFRLKLVYEMWLLSKISQAAFVATVGIDLFARRPGLFVWTDLHVALNRKLMVLTKGISMRAHRGTTNHLCARNEPTCLSFKNIPFITTQ